MAQRCERPDCSEAATVAYGFDPARAVAWLETLVEGASVYGGLCRRHAEAMVVPKGWWLEDRRTHEQLFLAPRAGAVGRRRPWRSRRAAIEPGVLPLDASEGPELETSDDGRRIAPVVPDVPDDPIDAAADDPTDAAAVDSSVVVAVDVADVTAPMPWVPAFAHDDDLDGVLNATSPLLARAFGNVKSAGTRTRPPAPNP